MRKSSHRVDKSNVKKKGDDGIGLLASAQALAASNHINSWIVDSGATCHICCNKMMFSEMKIMDRSQTITLGDGRSIESTSQGTVKLKLQQPDGTYKRATLYDVLYVPELSYNLLSVTKARVGKDGPI